MAGGSLTCADFDGVTLSAELRAVAEAHEQAARPAEPQEQEQEQEQGEPPAAAALAEGEGGQP